MNTIPYAHPGAKERKDGTFLPLVFFSGDRYAVSPYTFGVIFKTKEEATKYAGVAILDWVDNHKNKYSSLEPDKLHGKFLEFLRSYTQGS